MRDHQRQLFVAAVARSLDLDPELPVEDAASRASVLIGDPDDGLQLHDWLQRESLLTRRAVVNPALLADRGIEAHIFLASSRPGYLRQLIKQREEGQLGVSQFILYGEWDTLLVMFGGDEEADLLADSLESSTLEPPVRLTARPLVFKRHRVIAATSELEGGAIEAINVLVDDYDAASAAGERDDLVNRHHLLGSVWRSSNDSPYPVTAFVGVTVRGRGQPERSAVASALTGNAGVRDSLVDLFEIAEGRPYHYLLKLECVTASELDAVTTDLASLMPNGSRLDCVTLVVANYREELPSLARSAFASRVSLGPDLTRLVETAQRVLLELPVDARDGFEALPDLRQLSIVRSVVELQSCVDASPLDEQTKRRFATAISIFVQECAAGPVPNLTGSVAEAVTTAEGLVRRMLSKMAYRCLGNDPGLIQQELRLPTRAIGKLSLGRVASALHVASENPEFGAYRERIPPETVQRVEALADERNRWLHDAVGEEAGDLIEEARRVIVEAIHLSEWADSLRLEIGASAPVDADPGEVTVSEGVADRSRIFVSHATADAHYADRIAAALKVFGLDAWYAEWELGAGDSIVEQIDAALATSDVLLVVLSPQSVESRWVRRELSAGLAKQLAGQDVVVIPVVVEQCEIPPLLEDVVHIDLSEDFESGLMRLIQDLGGIQPS